MALTLAAEAGNANLIRPLLQHPQIDINCAVPPGKSALTEVIAFGDADIVAAFLIRVNMKAYVRMAQSTPKQAKLALTSVEYRMWRQQKQL